VKAVGAAFHGSIELTAGGVPELSTELIGQESEVIYRFRRHGDQRAGDSLIVVVHAFDGEVVVAGPLTADRRPHAVAHGGCVRHAVMVTIHTGRYVGGR
jgi:hypothetical protein